MRSSARTPRPAARSRMMRLRLLPVAHLLVSMPPMVCVVCPARMASSAWLSPWRVRCQARRVPVHPAGGSSVAWSGSGRPGELFHAGVERDGDAGEDPGRHVRGVAFPAIVLAQAAVWHVRVFGELWAAPSPFRAHPPDHGGPVLSLLGRLARETGGVDAEGLRPLPDLVGFERGQRGFAFLDPFDGRHIDAGEPCEGLFEDAFPFPDRA